MDDCVVCVICQAVVTSRLSKLKSKNTGRYCSVSVGSMSNISKGVYYRVSSERLGRAGLGGGESGASSTDSDECDARTPAFSPPASPVSRERSFGVRGISRKVNQPF